MSKKATYEKIFKCFCSLNEVTVNRKMKRITMEFQEMQDLYASKRSVKRQLFVQSRTEYHKNSYTC